MKRKVIYVKPELKDCSGDLTKQWYVEYQYRDPKTGRLGRFRIYKELNVPDEQERRSAARKIIKALDKKLLSGWNPYEPENKVFEDQIEYHNVARIYSRKRLSNNSIKINFSEFLSEYKLKLAPKSYESYQSKIRLFYQFIELKEMTGNDTQVLNNDLVKSFFRWLIEERNLDKVTVIKYKQNLNALFKYLLKKHLVFENPVYDIPIPPKKIDNKAQEFLAEDRKSLLDLIKSTDPQLYIACLFQYYCAIRPGTELRLLKVKHINFNAGLVTINPVDAKNGNARVIQLPDSFRQMLLERGINNYNKEFYVFSKYGIPGTQPLGKNTLRTRFNYFRDHLGLSKDYKFYSWKHSGAGSLDDINIPLRDIQKHLGHSSPEYTAIYLNRRRGFQNDKIKYNFPEP